MSSKGKLNKLNELLDEAINEVLIDTTDRFNILDDSYKEPKLEDFEEIERYKGSEEDDMSHIKEPTINQKVYYPNGNYDHGHSSTNYPDFKDIYGFDDDYVEVPPNYDKDSKRVVLDKFQEPDPYTKSNRYKDKDTFRSYQKPYSTDTYTYNRAEHREDVDDPKLNRPDYLRESQKVREPSGYQPYKRDEELYRSRSTYQKPTNIDTENSGIYHPREKHYEYINKPGVYKTPERHYQTERNIEKTNENSLRSQASANTGGQTIRQPQPQAQSTQEYQKEKVANDLEKLKFAVPRMVGRSEWGALPPMGNIERMQAPAETVVFSLNTDTSECKTQKECVRAVKEIQARQMGEGLADIQYSFLVGGDGNMYEGRGWGLESGVPKDKSEGMNYNIAFIGNFQDDTSKIPPDMLGPVQDLVVYAKLNKYVIGDKMIKEYKKPKAQM